ncbi:MAG: heme-binding protein [Proteobacteria bacterium]|nr:heme-binding protein [Pseudomonadota bacterium]
MTQIRFAAAAVVLALVPAAAGAQVLQERNMPLAIAQEIAQATVEACAAKNFNVTATVVDRAGVTRAVLRADRAGPHTVAASRDKAFTSASARNATAAMAEGVERNPAQRNVAAIEGFLLLGGGAPGGHLDEECANAGIEKVKAKLR